MNRALLALMLMLAILGAATAHCGDGGDALPTPVPPAVVTVTSPAFLDGERIPTEYTCDGNDTAPPLEWSGTPDGTASFAVVISDPDAPHRTFIHGIVFDLPSKTTTLEEGEFVPAFGTAGNNDFRADGYGGPCPPEGDGPHHYEFRVYALDAVLALEGEVVFLELEEAIEGHILSTGMLMGVYER